MFCHAGISNFQPEGISDRNHFCSLNNCRLCGMSPFFFFFFLGPFLMFHNVPPNVKGNTKKRCLKEEKKDKEKKTFLHYLIFFLFCLVFAAIDEKLHRHVIMKEMWLHHLIFFVSLISRMHITLQAQH